MSKKPASATVITANAAKQFGFPRIFRSGEVVGIILHNKSEVVVQDFHGIEKRQAVIKNGRGKRQPVPLSSIRALRVSSELAERILV